MITTQVYPYKPRRLRNTFVDFTINYTLVLRTASSIEFRIYALMRGLRHKSFNYLRSFYVQDRSCALAFRPLCGVPFWRTVLFLSMRTETTMRIALITTRLGRPSVGGMMNIPLKVFIFLFFILHIYYTKFFLFVKKFIQLFVIINKYIANGYLIVNN